MNEEHWTVAFATADGALAGVVRFGLWPAALWCWIHLLTADGLVVVRDHELARPSPAHLLARGEGIWCELVPEVPGEHWAVNAEAFGVRLDDPIDALHGEIGHRIPVGLELDWEAGAAAQPVDGGVAHAGTVRGEMLLGSDVLDIDAGGVFVHRMRDGNWRANPAPEALLCDATATAPLRSGAAVHVEVAGALVTQLAGERLGDPVAQAPVPLDDANPAVTVLARALCRTTAPTGERGWAWAERVVGGAG